MPLINFTYKSPHEDIESSSGFNSDGTLNVKFTLISFRNLLQANLNKISELLSESDSIDDIKLNEYGYDHVEIKFVPNSEHSIKKLTDLSIIVPNEEANTQIPFDLEQTETNVGRLAMINRLCSNTLCLQPQSEFDSDFESDELDPVIDPEQNLKFIIGKYKKLLSNESESE